MSRRRKFALIVAGSLAGVIVLVGITAVLVLRSAWFREQFRERIVAEVETSTGGRAEIGAIVINWRTLTAEVKDFVVHGKEPAGSAPLLRAASITIGIRIVSILKRMIDIESLNVDAPQAHLIVYPDGSTNVPAPKVKQTSSTDPVQQILDLAIHRFNLQHGVIEVNSRKTPWNARGENLRSQFYYDRTGSRYKGDLSIQPLQASWGASGPLNLGAYLAVTIEKNRIAISSAKLDTAESHVEVSGAVDNLAALQGNLQYRVQIALDEIGRTFNLKSRQQGTVELAGNARFTGTADYSLTGNLRTSAISFRQGTLRVNGIRAEAAIAADPQKVDISGIRLSGLGGDFNGHAEIQQMERFKIEGELNRFDVRGLAALAGTQPVPWDAAVSGPLRAQGLVSGLRRGDLDASLRLNISPVRGSVPVHGLVDASYSGRRDTLDLGKSWIALPSTRLDVSGTLGRKLNVRLHSTDLNDLMPAIRMASAAPKSLPVQLRNGSAAFEGIVRGPLSSPLLTGHLAVSNFMYEGELADSLTADLSLARSAATIQNASLARGKLKAQFGGSIGLRDWKPFDAGAVSATASLQNGGIGDLLALTKQGSASARGTVNLTARVSGTYGNPLVAANAAVRNADVAQLLAAAGQKSAAVTGTLNASAQMNGSLKNPRISADLNVSHGSVQDEPFDRLTAKVSTPGVALAQADAQISAGPKQISLKASFRHPPDDFKQGRLTFQLASNSMSLAQFQLIHKNQPDAAGSVQLNASGAVDIREDKAGAPLFQLADLNADVTAHSLEVDQKFVGDVHLTASTHGQTLHAVLDSNIADSQIHGEGDWQLTGDYPGGARLSVSKLDFAALRSWLPPSKTPMNFEGSAAANITVSGPAVKPELWTASLEMPQFEITPLPHGIDPKGPRFTLTNSSPIRLSMEKSVVHIASAHFVGKETDISITGSVSPRAKNPLDVRLEGKLNLTVLEDFKSGIQASGAIVADATVRGDFNQPQIGGRLELKNASFYMTDIPNGLSNANGVIVFTGNRASIQSLTAETGGGRVTLGGFASLVGGDIIFRVDAAATQVRFRYPEGVSTVADAALNLTGTSARSLLSGTVTVQRLSFEPRTDMGSLLSRSAEPVSTPSAQPGLLEGMQFDVQIETAPDISFQTALAEDIQAEANLRLRGTAFNPVLLGRINITQGTMSFFGNKYTIGQGSIAFYNPVKLEPVLNIDLQTKARGIDVTLTLSGTINKLNVSYRSDPPLQFSDIVALLATGRTPTSDPFVVSQQPADPSQSWQQMGASALVGQAIANPVAGRLQRFFGVSKLKIDPLLTGVENPQASARLTLEQQVTPDITFTYITNLTNSNPQIVRVEWAVNRQWSVVALREENGLFGIDFLYKRRFK